MAFYLENEKFYWNRVAKIRTSIVASPYGISITLRKIMFMTMICMYMFLKILAGIAFYYFVVSRK